MNPENDGTALRGVFAAVQTLRVRQSSLRLSNLMPYLFSRIGGCGQAAPKSFAGRDAGPRSDGVRRPPAQVANGRGDIGDAFKRCDAIRFGAGNFSGVEFYRRVHAETRSANKPSSERSI